MPNTPVFTPAQQQVIEEMAKEGAFIDTLHGKIRLKFPGRPPHPDGKLQSRLISTSTFDAISKAKRMKKSLSGPPTLQKNHPDFALGVMVHAKEGEVDAEFESLVTYAANRLACGDRLDWTRIYPRHWRFRDEDTEVSDRVVDALRQRKLAIAHDGGLVATTPEAEAAKEKVKNDEKAKNRTERFSRWSTIIIRALNLPDNLTYNKQDLNDAIETVANEARDCDNRKYEDPPREHSEY
jgi:hypothetical protein